MRRGPTRSQWTRPLRGEASPRCARPAAKECQPLQMLGRSLDRELHLYPSQAYQSGPQGLGTDLDPQLHHGPLACALGEPEGWQEFWGAGTRFSLPGSTHACACLFPDPPRLEEQVICFWTESIRQDLNSQPWKLGCPRVSTHLVCACAAHPTLLCVCGFTASGSSRFPFMVALPACLFSVHRQVLFKLPPCVDVFLI